MFNRVSNSADILVGIYLLKVDNRNTRARCEICSKFEHEITGWIVIT